MGQNLLTLKRLILLLLFNRQKVTKKALDQHFLNTHEIHKTLQPKLAWKYPGSDSWLYSKGDGFAHWFV